MNDQRLTAILKRSGNLPLRVRVSTDSEYRDKLVSKSERNNFEKILSQSRGITELEFPSMNVALAQQIINLYPSIQLPSLHKLSVEYCRHDPLLHSYDSRILPNLKQLKVTNFVPRPILATNMTCCSLKYTSHFDILSLADFLGVASSLKDLTLELGHITSTAMSSPADRYPLVTNTNVLSLNLNVLRHCSPLAPWVKDCIRLLNVIDMSMKISNRAALPFLFDVPMLKNLRVKAIDDGGYLSFGSILRYAPQNMTSLSLRAPNDTFGLDWGENEQRSVLPRLRTLHFIECDSMDHDFLKEVRAKFLKDGVEIEKVEVIKCREILRQTLRDIFPNSEVLDAPIICITMKASD
ncbi:hypothetical protein EW145_g1546 [Phellinidium pouzarii]|uniref:Uncharacterized protein n=1 Tax=Phellinidium pouzarii TaxID=167371 RepID=A0A4V3XDK7_9AGAM|nr:hypothetical protein EW145_g1546 [Phellinidium pouzarii]